MENTKNIFLGEITLEIKTICYCAVMKKVDPLSIYIIQFSSSFLFLYHFDQEDEKSKERIYQKPLIKRNVLSDESISFNKSNKNSVLLCALYFYTKRVIRILLRLIYYEINRCQVQ